MLGQPDDDHLRPPSTAGSTPVGTGVEVVPNDQTTGGPAPVTLNVGWFDSPANACSWNGCPSDGSTTGRASFGFVSRHQSGATTPTGNTAFQFRASGLTFRGTSNRWLAVAGARAQFKGEGQISGDAATYGFLITAIDGAISGGGDTDRFRIKLWDVGIGTVVYDNQIGQLDDSDAASALGGGSIVIHK